MIKIPVAAVLAISSIAALSACSHDNGYNQGPSRVSYAAPQAPALSSDMIQQVQSRLQQAGNYNGRVDGQWGPATEAGVRTYQQQHNLNPTGQLDGNTLAALDLGATRQAYVQPNANTQPNVNTQPNGERGNNVAPMNSNAPYNNTAPSSPATTR